jgi:hypothetical protein
MYLQATLRVVWARRGQTPIIKVHPGRESAHFYGTLNLYTSQELAMRVIDRPILGHGQPPGVGHP